MYKRLELVIFGKVQGIFFRRFVKENATVLGLNGIVENRTDGTVRVTAEGEENNLEKLIELCEIGPKQASIENIEMSWSEPTNKFKKFIIKY